MRLYGVCAAFNTSVKTIDCLNAGSKATMMKLILLCFFQAEDGIRDIGVTGVQTCALPILLTKQGSIHCVNLAQGIKEPIIYYQQHPEKKYTDAVKKGFADIRKYNGMAHGLYGEIGRASCRERV